MITRTLTADEIKYLAPSLGVSTQADIEKALLDKLNSEIASMVAKNKKDERAIKISTLVNSADPRVDALVEELKPKEEVKEVVK